MDKYITFKKKYIIEGKLNGYLKVFSLKQRNWSKSVVEEKNTILKLKSIFSFHWLIHLWKIDDQCFQLQV